LIYTSCNKESEQDAIEETINKNYSTENSIESPCANRDAKYDETLNNYLEIKNGEQAEIIAQLILIETSDIIRTIHLDKGQTYKIRHIPEGIYRVDVVYGEGYIQGPTAGKCEGIFKNKKLSETGSDKLDYHVIPRENGKDVPSYSLAVDMLPEQTRNQNSDVKSKSIDMQTSQENKATNSFISSSATNKISKNQAEPNCA